MITHKIDMSHMTSAVLAYFLLNHRV